MKKAFALIAIVASLLLSSVAFAQDSSWVSTGSFRPNQTLWGLNWEISKPVGDFDKYISDVSLRGISFEGRSFVRPNLSLGVSFSWNRWEQTFNNASYPITNGTVVVMIPATNRLRPAFWRPTTKAGPELIPTTAMKVLSPTEFIIQSAGSGTRPKVRYTDRSHPKIRPAMSEPALVLRLMGIPPTLIAMAPTRPPRTIPVPTKTMSVMLVGRSA